MLRAVSEAELKENAEDSSSGPSVARLQLSWEQTPVLCKLVSFSPFTVYFRFLVKFIFENFELKKGREIFFPYPSWALGSQGLPGPQLCWWQLQHG